MKQHVFYNPATGEIEAWELNSQPSQMPGLSVLTLDKHQVFTPATHKIVAGKIVVKTVAETKVANTPTAIEVNQAIARELAATDQYMLPDRGLTTAELQAWITYRKTLRDLSKNPTISTMLHAWPKRPTGADIGAFLRVRL